jgi:hypothetical protein
MTSLLLRFCEWLNDTRWSTALRESPWDYYIIGAVHLLGIAWCGGLIVIGDLRLLGIAVRGMPALQLLDQLRPWKWAAFGVVALSGGLLALSEPLDCYHSRSFWISMALLALAGINGALFRMRVYRGLGTWDASARAPAAARWAACISLFLWVAMVFAGRAIAFF